MSPRPFKPATSPVIDCKYCHDLIVMVRTRPKNRWMPCNPGPRPAAPGLVTVTLDGRVIRGAVDGVEGLEPHYATCTSGRYRRRPS